MQAAERGGEQELQRVEHRAGGADGGPADRLSRLLGLPAVHRVRPAGPRTGQRYSSPVCRWPAPPQATQLLHILLPLRSDGEQ